MSHAILFQTKVLKTGNVEVRLTDPSGANEIARVEVAFNDRLPQGHPERYAGLPRWPSQVRDAAKVALRKALAN